MELKRHLSHLIGTFNLVAAHKAEYFANSDAAHDGHLRDDLTVTSPLAHGRNRPQQAAVAAVADAA